MLECYEDRSRCSHSVCIRGWSFCRTCCCRQQQTVGIAYNYAQSRGINHCRRNSGLSLIKFWGVNHYRRKEFPTASPSDDADLCRLYLVVSYCRWQAMLRNWGVRWYSQLPKTPKQQEPCKEFQVEASQHWFEPNPQNLNWWRRRCRGTLAPFFFSELISLGWVFKDRPNLAYRSASTIWGKSNFT